MLLRRATCGLLFAALPLGCKMPDERPGELVGVYHVEGALMENACGSGAVPAVDPLSFDVEVRVSDGSGLWLASTPPAFPGRLEDDGDFQFERESSYSVNANGQPPDPAEVQTEMDIESLADPERYDRADRARAQPCALLISERITGKLLRMLELDGGVNSASGDGLDVEVDAEDEDADLVGENEIRIRAASGDCAVVLQQNGGPFEALPCSVRYDLQGELVEDSGED